jgi:hypothetical protein
MNQRMNSRGSLGIISLLIVSLIITFLLVQPNIFLRDKETNGTLETGIDDVEQAKEVTRSLEEQYSDTIRLSE